MISTVIYKALKNDSDVNSLFEEIAPGVISKDLEKNKLYLSYGLTSTNSDYTKGFSTPFAETYSFVFEIFGLIHSNVSKASDPIRKVLDNLIYKDENIEVVESKMVDMYNDSKLYEVGVLHSRVIEFEITIDK